MAETNTKSWHTKSIEETVDELRTNAETGLSSAEAQKRLELYGPNRLKEKRRKSTFVLFLEQFNDYLIYILIAAAVISILLGEVSDALIILVVVLINAIVGVVQESRAEKAIEALKKLSAPHALVVRDGRQEEIDAAEVVPGDLIVIDAGRAIPCDLRWIEAVNLKVDEASLTGESVPVEKDATYIAQEDAALGDRINMGYLSTTATYGRGKGIAVATGMDTELGNIAEMLESEPQEQTPLQVKLDEFGKKLGTGILILCGVMFVLGLGEELIKTGIIPLGSVFELFLTSVSLAVAAIPEGLPAIVTIVLAIGVQVMSKENAIVRRLPAVETLGSVTMICSDKTGTLTRNKMSVTAFASDGIEGEVAQLNIDRKAHRLLLEAMALCNDATIGEQTDGAKEGGAKVSGSVQSGNSAQATGAVQATGDPTEIALLEMAQKYGIEKARLLEKMPRIGEVPFDSERKMMSTIHAVPSGEADSAGRVIMTKGAVDQLLKKCDRYYFEGKELPLDDSARAMILASCDAMAVKALRVLGAAYRPLAPDEPAQGEALESNLCYLGAVGMIDPPRLEVRDSIAICRKSGIGVAMITGDHKATALAIARELGIAQSMEEALSGPEIDQLSDAQLAEKAKHVRVFARVSPEHKVRIVKAFKANGHIVSMTGDGVNDAPSLKVADIGVAMGITGTDVAKGAADMILTDDNFATIVRAVETGRNIYNNIRKAVLYLVSCNVGEIVAVFSAVLVGFPIPLLPIHILWTNLVTDTFPALSLGMDPGDPNVINEKPRDPNEGLFARGRMQSLVLNGILIGVLALAAFFIGDARARVEGYSGDFVVQLGRTMAFATLSLSQLFHAFNLRNQTKSIFQIGLFSNRSLVGAFVVGLLLQVLVIAIPPAAAFFKVTTLGWVDWLIVTALAVFPITVNEIVKVFLRRREKAALATL
ncbi:MAG TPA: cation-translocating P-type ATPase [Spirochaetales bacterium]|nr:cation-translocating P-type ATPase [Spirochaetales bacterium]